MLHYVPSKHQSGTVGVLRCFGSVVLLSICCTSRNAFCGTWYLPHSHVYNERTVPIIMAGCIVHAQNGRISTSGEKSDVTVVFPDPDFLNDAKFW